MTAKNWRSEERSGRAITVFGLGGSCAAAAVVMANRQASAVMKRIEPIPS